MSDEFLRIARQEIGAELKKMEDIMARSKDDRQIFENSTAIKSCLHKIKGLAPMAGEEEIGEIARTGDAILRHIIETGKQVGSLKIMERAIDDMKNIFHGLSEYTASDFKKTAKSTFPHIAGL
ncbi:MAG TPA: hypothetical protein VJ792_04125 [Candidatus Nitrosotalea sp.]|nr:hypothetical protein [Candidatus Nitrosotalea sp.]